MAVVTDAALAEPWVVRHRGFVAGAVIVAMVLVATGWPISIGFWLIALVLIAASAYMTMLLLIPGFLVLIPVRALFERGNAPWHRRAAHLTVPVGKLAIWLWCYLTTFDLGGVTDVRLPFANANASALGIMLAASVAWLVASGHREAAEAWLRDALTPPPPLPESSAGDLAEPSEPEDVYWSDEPVVVWRSWTWTGTLRGFVVSWPTPTLSAFCPQCPEPPAWSHTCGIYGVKDRADIPRSMRGSVDVYGRVELWGDVIEHEFGYRASHARIIELWARPELVDAVRERYRGVEVHPWVLEGRFYG